jgi:hypothetical protein
MLEVILTRSIPLALLRTLLNETIHHGLTAATSHNTVASLFMQNLLSQGKVTRGAPLID